LRKSNLEPRKRKNTLTRPLLLQAYYKADERIHLDRSWRITFPAPERRQKAERQRGRLREIGTALQNPCQHPHHHQKAHPIDPSFFTIFPHSPPPLNPSLLCSTHSQERIARHNSTQVSLPCRVKIFFCSQLCLPASTLNPQLDIGWAGPVSFARQPPSHQRFFFLLLETFPCQLTTFTTRIHIQQLTKEGKIPVSHFVDQI